jgi:2-oxoglutarate dehydrogenase E2 component (dihydrolipoamide succinyltransferase)
MPIVEITVPSPGESITEVEIATFLKQDGDYVFLDEEICEVDSDKATLTIPAEKAGSIAWKVDEGDAVEVGGIICTIDTDASRLKMFLLRKWKRLELLLSKF